MIMTYQDTLDWAKKTFPQLTPQEQKVEAQRVWRELELQRKEQERKDQMMRLAYDDFNRRQGITLKEGEDVRLLPELEYQALRDHYLTVIKDSGDDFQKTQAAKITEFDKLHPTLALQRFKKEFGYRESPLLKQYVNLGQLTLAQYADILYNQYRANCFGFTDFMAGGGELRPIESELFNIPSEQRVNYLEKRYRSHKKRPTIVLFEREYTSDTGKKYKIAQHAGVLLHAPNGKYSNYVMGQLGQGGDVTVDTIDNLKQGYGDKVTILKGTKPITLTPKGMTNIYDTTQQIRQWLAEKKKYQPPEELLQMRFSTPQERGER